MPCYDTSLDVFFKLEVRLDKRPLGRGKEALQGMPMRQVNVLGRPTCREACGIVVKICLTPFERELGSCFCLDGLWERCDDAAVPVEAGAHEVEEDGFDGHSANSVRAILG